jgi:hypothetical protein
MARRQNHRTGVTRLECFCPASHADAPAVAGRQAGEIIFGARRDQVVAAHHQKVEKGLRDLAANRMQPAILRARPAITIAVKPRHGRSTAAFQFTTQNIRRHDPSVPQPHPGSSAWVAKFCPDLTLNPNPVSPKTPWSSLIYRSHHQPIKHGRITRRDRQYQ